ncbi:MAG: VanZ family protein [Rubrivivax sp.]
MVIAIGILATLPKPPVEVTLGWDKLNHGFAFAALALAACLAHPHPLRLRIGAWTALLGYGALIEAVQSSVPGRTADWADLLADAIGIGIGACLGAYVLRWSRAAPVRAP